MAGSVQYSGTWQAHHDDIAGTKWLARSGAVIAPIRGPPLVRISGRFDMNPLVMRVDRGWLEPLGKVDPEFVYGTKRPSGEDGTIDIEAHERHYVSWIERLRPYNSAWKQFRYEHATERMYMYTDV